MDNRKYVFVIYPDKTTTVLSWNPKNKLNELQKLVGGYIEVVPTKISDYCMVVNEEGKLLDLPMNEEATSILPEAIRKLDSICGKAVLMKRGTENLEPLTKAEALRWVSIIKNTISNK